MNYFYDMADQGRTLIPAEMFTRMVFAAAVAVAIGAVYILMYKKNGKNIMMETGAVGILSAALMIIAEKNIVVALAVAGIMIAFKVTAVDNTANDNGKNLYIAWAAVTGVTTGVGDYILTSVVWILIALLLILIKTGESREINIEITAVDDAEEEIKNTMYRYLIKPAVINEKKYDNGMIIIKYSINRDNLDKSEKKLEKESIKSEENWISLEKELLKIQGVKSIYFS